MNRIALLYTALATLTGLAYWLVRPTIIAQEPSGEMIVVSNLSLNLVLFALLVGAFVPHVTRRLFPKRFKLMLIPVALAVGVLFLLALKVLGMDMRF